MERNKLGRFEKGHISLTKKDLDESKVISLYSKIKSINKIAKKMDCSPSLIYKILKNNQIKTSLKGRPYEEIYGKEKVEERKEKSRIARQKRKESLGCINLPETREKLRTKALKQFEDGMPKSTRDKIANIHKSSGRFLGEKNPAWLDGKSFEPYSSEFNNKFKRAIRKRDNYICMLCGIHSEKLKQPLHIHHINYDKRLTVPQNCISLCNFCHGKTTTNRETWKSNFQELLSKQYDYKYENENIILNYQLNNF